MLENIKKTSHEKDFIIDDIRQIFIIFLHTYIWSSHGEYYGSLNTFPPPFHINEILLVYAVHFLRLGSVHKIQQVSVLNKNWRSKYVWKEIINSSKYHTNKSTILLLINASG